MEWSSPLRLALAACQAVLLVLGAALLGMYAVAQMDAVRGRDEALEAFDHGTAPSSQTTPSLDRPSSSPVWHSNTRTIPISHCGVLHALPRIARA